MSTKKDNIIETFQEWETEEGRREKRSEISQDSFEKLDKQRVHDNKNMYLENFNTYISQAISNEQYQNMISQLDLVRFVGRSKKYFISKSSLEEKMRLLAMVGRKFAVVVMDSEQIDKVTRSRVRPLVKIFKSVAANKEAMETTADLGLFIFTNANVMTDLIRIGSAHNSRMYQYVTLAKKASEIDLDETDGLTPFSSTDERRIIGWMNGVIKSYELLRFDNLRLVGVQPTDYILMVEMFEQVRPLTILEIATRLHSVRTRRAIQYSINRLVLSKMIQKSDIHTTRYELTARGMKFVVDVVIKLFKHSL